MHLSNVLAQRPEATLTEKYFTCLIEESFVTLAIWGVVADHPKVLTIGTPKEWQELSSLIDAVEIGLEEFHEQSEGISKVLFSLPDQWVDTADIKPEYKEVLKKMTQKLALQPVGFVVTVEALFHYIFQYKTSSARTLFLQVSSTQYTLFLSEHGKLLQKEQFGRSDQFVDDLVEGLSRLEAHPLPAQMYFFSFDLPIDQLEEDKQLFMKHDWEAQGLFRHLPSIEMLSRSDMVEAACITGGAETLRSGQSKKSDEHSDEKVSVLKHVTEAKEELTPVPEGEFGFSQMDVSEEDTDSEPEIKPKVFSFGIPIPQRVIQPPGQTEAEQPEFAIENEEETIPSHSPRLKLAFRLPTFTFPQFTRGKKENSTPTNKTPGSLYKKKNLHVILTVLVFCLLFGAGAGVYAWGVSQRGADIKVTLKTTAVSADAVINLDPLIAATDTENKILKVKVVTKNETDSEETSTTGSKIVGENAKGTITILNKTTNLKTFPKGTQVKSGTKVFTTDQEVSIASASTKETSDGQTMEYGKKDVAITASAIGAESNVDKNTEFLIANFSKDTYAARNDKALSGGSSHEIQAVAKEDLQKLSKSLKTTLLDKAQKDLKSEVAEGEYLVLSGKSKVLSEEYSAKVGDETNTLKLTTSLSVEGYTYRAEDLNPIAKDQLLALVPDGGVLLEDKISILSKENDESSSSAKLSLDATLSSQYIPPTSSEQWLDEIVGKTVEQAKQVLSEKAEISSVTVELTPKIAGLLSGKLPYDKKRITLTKKVE